MRYFLELSYNGSSYNGWQRQPGTSTVQGTLEKALSTLLRSDILVTGAGRTDTGVHAAYYVAHIDTFTEIPDPTDFLYHLNALLPADIVVHTLVPVAATAHARFDALEREYRYFVSATKTPFGRDLCWQYFVPLDLARMNEAAASLLEESDFTTFAKLHSGNRTNLCKVSKAEWNSPRKELYVFTIRADRFLRNMVRAIVGTLIDVGRGKMTPEEFRDILRRRDLSLASGSAPAHGLYLWDVTYSETTYKRHTTCHD